LSYQATIFTSQASPKLNPLSLRSQTRCCKAIASYNLRSPPHQLQQRRRTRPLVLHPPLLQHPRSSALPPPRLLDKITPPIPHPRHRLPRFPRSTHRPSHNGRYRPPNGRQRPHSRDNGALEGPCGWGQGGSCTHISRTAGLIDFELP
jgi:hypothetical protein